VSGWYELQPQVGGGLFEVHDALFEGIDVVGCTDAGCLPYLLAE
jgi:hypothetical protein